jgi:hypothetical protein
MLFIFEVLIKCIAVHVQVQPDGSRATHSDPPLLLLDMD